MYDFFKDFSGAMVAISVGLFASWIAYNQWMTARNKLKLDLFEKRLEIYESTKRHLGHIMSTGNPEFEKSLDFIRSVNSSKFLFNEEIYKYLWEIYEKSIQLRAISEEFKELQDSERIEKIAKKSELILWFGEQFDVLDTKCKKYMKMEY